MRFIADLHIHSHYSVATSKDLTPERLDFWARMKGITVVGTGDFTHPGWLTELKEKLEPAEEGLYKLKDELRIAGAPETPVRFLLSAEISSIYKKNGKVRKIHNVILAPDFETVEQIQARLGQIGNITSDGRPILGFDARNLLELTLEVNDRCFFIPAHIWTPWFSALGSKSGFDSIEECFEDLTPHIYAVETGLSSDPPMNWMCSFLDRYTLVSNSDAHSPEKLGREANLFNTDLSYTGITNALKDETSSAFLGTVEFYPQEGKYHLDGHRKCGIRWDPLQTLKNRGICPVCGKKVTVGVLNRVAQLSDRDDIYQRANTKEFYSLIPLKEVLSEILGVGANSKKVEQAYQALIQKAGSEFDLLLHLPLNDLGQLTNEVLQEAIRRMRERQVIVNEGYDGEFGQVKVFAENEQRRLATQKSLFGDLVQETETQYHLVKPIPFDLKEFRRLQKTQNQAESAEAVLPTRDSADLLLQDLNPEQQSAVRHFRGPALVLAGPGTGKTRVLTRRIAYLIQQEHVAPENILAITFTNKAAQEIQERVRQLLKVGKHAALPFMGTFHALGLRILTEQAGELKRQTPLIIFDENDRKKVLKALFELSQEELNELNQKIHGFKTFAQKPDDALFNQRLEQYEHYLQQQNGVDLEDLIFKTVQLLQEHPEILKVYRQRFQWILVDEYQDVNEAQYRLLQLLAPGSAANLFAIGDPNQAIYGFRGADVRFIQKFEEDYPAAKKYALKVSYRCTDNILKASGLILGQGGFLSGLDRGVKLRIVQEATEKSEAEFVARTIEEMMGGVRFFSMDSAITQGDQAARISSFSDFAVLVRINRMIPVLEKAFNDHSIPYQLVGHDSFLHEPPIRNFIEILRSFLAPNSAIFTQLWPADAPNGVDQALLQRYPAGKTAIVDLLEVIAAHFVPLSSNQEKRRFKKLLELAEPFGKDLQGFLQWTFLGHGQDLYRPGVEQVTLMTLHAAKGLEFNCVFIVGCEEGLLPYTLLKSDTVDRQEERRLLYVGMTRAKRYLFLSHAQKRFLFGQTYRLPRSPFLDAIEQELIELQKRRPRPKKKDDGQLSLFDRL